MKPTILKLSTLFLFLLFIGASCQNDEDLFEIQRGDENAVIQKEVNGIEFKFCLLNEAGEPATVFNEGENFTFQFSIKNNTKKDIFFDTTVTNADGFFEVHDELKNYGGPFEKPTYDLLRMPTPIGTGEITGLNIKWIPEDDEWAFGTTEFVKAQTESLKAGEYYSMFSHKFDFESIKTNDISFKINFEIK
ncbi:hypothetical protein [Draconibacterium halophilum]|uniref:Uncharacterized protein n=1 Tax=Draconibacterium halophilum TaxID=2706887 RepID=A0A6C0RG65_9BACT|nr:hypothetical protein [Draconibacterium halophilum]QIA09057.1 hypothetical protein G0Q07_15640 [Draconibacterium halophilum]